MVEATELLGWNDAALLNVQQTRGWTTDAICRLEVGWDGNRALIPVHEQSGDLLGHLHYDPTGEARPKMLAETGVPRELFPAPEMVATEEALNRTLLLVEGEPDCVLAWSLGMAAVGVPGAQNWRPEWAWRLRSRGWTIAVIFDCDRSGRTGAAAVANDLANAGVDARVVDLDPTRDDGWDLTDWSRHG